MTAAATRALLAASARLVLRGSFLTPVLLAPALVVATWPVLDEGYAVLVLRGVGVVLACAWVLTTDDPGGEVLAASPVPRAVRFAARLLVGAAVLVPVWAVSVLAVVTAAPAAPAVPALGLGLEALALGALGLAVGFGLRAWRGLLEPAHVAVLGLLAVVLGLDALPRWYVLRQGQTWGPPWEAAQVRWAGVLLLALAVVALALRDPLADAPRPARAPSRPRRRGWAGVDLATTAPTATTAPPATPAGDDATLVPTRRSARPSP